MQKLNLDMHMHLRRSERKVAGPAFYGMQAASQNAGLGMPGHFGPNPGERHLSAKKRVKNILFFFLVFFCKKN